ncbi:unnamed protein product [Victoria cruziana]
MIFLVFIVETCRDTEHHHDLGYCRLEQEAALG